LLDQKRNKKIKPQYFYPKNYRTNFHIATPAARAPHSTRGSLPPASAEIFTVIFWSKNIRAVVERVIVIVIFGDDVNLNFYT
jgi:hypothetical protein